MSLSHCRATAQNFAEFAQNLEMFTPELEMSCIFTIFTYVWVFLHLLCEFLGIFCTFSCATFTKVQFCWRKKNNFQNVCAGEAESVTIMQL